MSLPNGSIANLLVTRKACSDPTSGIPLLFLSPRMTVFLSPRMTGFGDEGAK
jgi:hypothetical protein